MFIRGHAIVNAFCSKVHFLRASSLLSRTSARACTCSCTSSLLHTTVYRTISGLIKPVPSFWRSSRPSRYLSVVIICSSPLRPSGIQSLSVIASPCDALQKKACCRPPTASLLLLVDYANLAMSHICDPEGFTLATFALGTHPILPIGEYTQLA